MNSVMMVAQQDRFALDSLTDFSLQSACVVENGHSLDCLLLSTALLIAFKYVFILDI